MYPRFSHTRSRLTCAVWGSLVSKPKSVFLSPLEGRKKLSEQCEFSQYWYHSNGSRTISLLLLLLLLLVWFDFYSFPSDSIAVNPPWVLQPAYPPSLPFWCNSIYVSPLPSTKAKNKRCLSLLSLLLLLSVAVSQSQTQFLFHCSPRGETYKIWLMKGKGKKKKKESIGRESNTGRKWKRFKAAINRSLFQL